ncbi:acyl-CoA dehydrogenase family protein [Nocardioides sp. Bht2]|uniref:acyl-CoA dehydrogenase family protein n=1 Tax=Nocardioides sp. Bht2 TaxID=3392297 RepID=UPI0039B40F77
MDFTHDDEQNALREAVRGLLTKNYSDYENRRRTVSTDLGYDARLWGQLAEMGILGLPFAETDGGTGAGPIEVALVAEEIGRVLAPEPFIPAVVLAGGLIAELGTPEQRAEHLGALSEGTSVPAFAHTEAGTRWTASATAVHATADGDAWRLDGVKEPVPYGDSADLLVVSAALDGGTGLFLVDGGADGVSRAGFAVLDGSKAARIEFRGASATRLGSGDATVAIEAAADRARVIAGNQAVGVMEAALGLTAGYLTSRKQFGVTLNNFQALTFRAADMYVALELARSMVAWATMVLAEQPEGLSRAATRAGLQVSRAGRMVGQSAIQLHGGIGMTAEYAIGAHTATLTSLEQQHGMADDHLSRLAATVGDYEEVDPLN